MLKRTIAECDLKLDKHKKYFFFYNLNISPLFIENVF